MAEPATSMVTASVVATTVGIAAWLTKLDPGAVFGAFAGAVTFAITSRDTNLVPRLVYALISLVVGYSAVPDLVGLSPIKEPLVIAFVASAVVVQTTVTVIDRIKTMSVRAVWDALVSVFRKGA